MIEPQLTYDIEEQASLMKQDHGIEKAKAKAKELADAYHDEIETLPYYDKTEVTYLTEKRNFWLRVEQTLKNQSIIS